jgi:hypothetical protein
VVREKTVAASKSALLLLCYPFHNTMYAVAESSVFQVWCYCVFKNGRLMTPLHDFEQKTTY